MGDFNRTLENNLAEIQIVEDLTSKDECLEQITKLDTAIKTAIKEHVPVKRWWTKDLTAMKRQKEWLARNSYRRRAIDEDPIHKEFRQARNRYSMMIRKTKEEHWVEWLETLDEEGMWTENWMVSGPATDGGRSRIPTLVVRDPISKEIIREACTNKEKGQVLYQAFFPK